ncbi:MAG TPA: hypothetical protein VNX17_07830 [Edaphobacter sp.]|jgi:hypothetical protein|nr:hypothetical protein [Edaphobacter sp.]
MKLQLLVVCLAFALTNIAALAQDNPSTVNASTASTTGIGSTDIGLYVNPIGIGISNSKADTGVFAFLGEGATQRTFYGAAIGGYVNFFHAQKYDAGVDLRDIIVSGNGAHLNSFLVGGRVAVKPLAEKFKPYVQLSVGVGSSKAPHSPIKLNRFQLGIYGGLDYTLAKHVDFRAFELGYGSVSTINSGNFNGTTSFSASSLFSVSTGLVFRVP